MKHITIVSLLLGACAAQHKPVVDPAVAAREQLANLESSRADARDKPSSTTLSIYGTSLATGVHDHSFPAGFDPAPYATELDSWVTTAMKQQLAAMKHDPSAGDYMRMGELYAARADVHVATGDERGAYAVDLEAIDHGYDRVRETLTQAAQLGLQSELAGICRRAAKAVAKDHERRMTVFEACSTAKELPGKTDDERLASWASADERRWYADAVNARAREYSQLGSIRYEEEHGHADRSAHAHIHVQ